MAEACTDVPTDPAAETPGRAADLIPLILCCLIWGTTWFAITLQLGGRPDQAVAPVVSAAYRFAIASALLFAWLVVRRRPLGLTRPQHLATLGQGAFMFAVNYAFVYLAEARISSAATAVVFSALAFVNLVLFRLVFGQRTSPIGWIAAGLGVAGVAVMSFAELQRAHMDFGAWIGLGLAVTAMTGGAIGNLFAHRVHQQGVDVVVSAAWAMAYGAAFMALGAIAGGAAWRFQMTPAYVGSLVYLSLFGSVAAFLLYFGLARRRGWTFASYISAITPPIAMLVSVLFEHARWQPSALLGIALVVAGQVLLIRQRRG